MRVKITKIFIENNKDIDVEFDTEFGNCKGTWMGVKPIVGNTYEIEIEIPSTLTWGHDILLAQNKIFQMKINETGVSLIGILEAIDDNLVSLKLGDSIILIETRGTPFIGEIFVEFVAEKIVVYDIDI